MHKIKLLAVALGLALSTPALAVEGSIGLTAGSGTNAGLTAADGAGFVSFLHAICGGASGTMGTACANQAQVNSSGQILVDVANASVAVTGTFWQATQPVSGTFWQTTQPVSGTFWQTTQPVSAASLPLPTGAATSANQEVTTAGVSASSAQGVQGVTGGIALPVSAASLPLPTSASTSALQTTGNTALTTINTTLGTPMQQTGGTIGISAWGGTAVTNVPTAVGTAGTGNTPTVNAYIVGGAGSGGTAGADAATWTAGTTNQTPMGCEYTSGGATALVTAHMGTAGCTSARGLFTDKSSVSGTALATATESYGTAFASQTATVERVDAFVTNTNGNGSATSANSSPVVIASDQAAVAVKAASGALASGSIASGALASGSISSGAAVSGAFVAGSIADLAHGQGAMAASVPVAIASNQSSIPVTVGSGGIASGALASGSVASGALAAGSISSGAAVSGAFVAGSIADLAHGQAAMAASVPVAIANNQSSIPVTVGSGGIASGALASGSVASGALAAGSISSGAAVSGAFATGSITDLAIAQGAALSGKVGNMGLVSSTTGAPSYSAGLNPLSGDLAGNLRVNCITGCSGGSGGTSATDEAAFGFGSGTYTPGGGVYNSTITNLTSGQGGAASLSQQRFTLTAPGAALMAGTTWTAGTTSSTTQPITNPNAGASAYLVELDQGSGISGGAITFQVSGDGVNWVAPASFQVIDPTSPSGSGIGIPYTLVASTNKYFVIYPQGEQVRLEVSTTTAGGSITPYITPIGYPQAVALLPGNAAVGGVTQSGSWTVLPSAASWGLYADNLAWTAGTSVGQSVECEYTSGGATALTTGHSGAVGCTTNRDIFTDKSSVDGTALGAVVSNLGTLASGTPAAENVNAYIVGSTALTVAQATAANLNATVVGTGTFADQATLQAGSAIVGKVGIDQTTVGTTNGMSLAQVGANTVSTGAGATGTGTQRVGVAQDTTTIAGSAPGTAGTASTAVLTVQGVTSMTPVQVSQATAASLNATVVGTGTFADQATLQAGSAIAGKFGIDQTTAGTTNAVSIADIGTNAVLTGSGAVGTGSQRVAVGTDTATIAGSAPTTVLLEQPQAGTTGAASQTGNIVANNTTAVVVKGSAGTLYSIQMSGIGSAPAYLKLYNATSATCGSGTPVGRYMIPAASTAANGGGSNIDLGPVGVAYGTGITYCVTTGIADADTTAPAASTFLVNLVWK